MAVNRDLLIKICGQFGSDMPAVRAQAAERANRMVKDADTTWAALLAEPARGGTRANLDARNARPPPRPATPPPPPAPKADTAQAADAAPVPTGDVPRTVIGSISVLALGPPLSIMVDDGNNEWGPIAVTQPDLVAAAREGGFRMRTVWTRKDTPAAMPVAYRIV